MLFIIADYIQKNFSDIFKKKVKLSPIIPIYDTDDDSYYHSDYDSDSFYINEPNNFKIKPGHITILCRFSTQEELDALV
jgi:hypothetical protein